MRSLCEDALILTNRCCRAQVRALTIRQSQVDIETPTGRMRTYILQPNAPGKYPGIVFYSEIFQVSLQDLRQ